MPWSSFGQSNGSATTPPPQVQPFNDDELREILIRLYDLGSAWAQVDAQRLALDQLQEFGTRERWIHQQELDLEQKKTAIAERERDLEKQRATFFEAQTLSLKKGRGAGCWIKKILTAGLGRCS